MAAVTPVSARLVRAARARRGERAQVADGLAADQADGHREHAEGKQQAADGGAVADLAEVELPGLGLDGGAEADRGLAGRVDLHRGEGGGGLDQPAAGTIVSCSALTAPSVMTVFGTEVPAGSLPTSWTTGFWMHSPTGHGVFGGWAR